MAVVLEQSGHAVGNGVSSITSTFTLNSVSNAVLIAVVALNNDNLETVSGITWNSVALSVHSTVETVDDARCEVWRLIAPSAGNFSLVTTFSATLLRQALAGYAVVSGAHQTTPLGTASTAAAQSGAGTTVTVTPASDTSDLIIAVVCGEQCTSLTPGALQTDFFNANVVSNTYGAGSTKAGSAVLTTMSYVLGTDEHRAMIGVAIKPAAGGVVGPLLGGHLVRRSALRGRLV